MIPPNALKLKLRRAIDTAGERFGAVPAATNGVGPVPGAVAAMLAGPSEFGRASAVGVTASVEDRASMVAVTAEDDAWPCSNILPIFMMSVAEPGLIAANEPAESTPSACCVGVNEETWNIRLDMVAPFGYGMISLVGLPILMMLVSCSSTFASKG